jgi:hypothetical protein
LAHQYLHGSSRVKRTVFIAEFVVIIVPFAALLVFFAVAVVAPSLSFGLRDLAMSMLIVTAVAVPFGCGLRLSVTYLMGGATRLVRLHRLWWYGAGAGSLVPIVGFVACIVRLIFGDFAVESVSTNSDEQPFGPARVGLVGLAVVTTPLLLPLGHLWSERRRAISSPDTEQHDAR